LRNLVLSSGSVDRVKSVALSDFWEISVSGNAPSVGFGDGDSGACNFEDGVASGELWVEMSPFPRKGRDSHPLVHRDNTPTTVVNKSLRIT
jgi:hypothetical protein